MQLYIRKLMSVYVTFLLEARFGLHSPSLPHTAVIELSQRKVIKEPRMVSLKGSMVTPESLMGVPQSVTLINEVMHEN